jgi:hypothetical protein
MTTSVAQPMFDPIVFTIGAYLSFEIATPTIVK